MKLSRADVFPILVILAGGSLGAALTVAPRLLFAPSDAVPVPVQPVVSSPEEEPAPVRVVARRNVPVWSRDGTTVTYRDANGREYLYRSGDEDPDLFVVSPDGQWIVFESADGGLYRVRAESGEAEPMQLSRDGSITYVGSTTEPLWIFDTESVGSSPPQRLDPGDIERIEILKGDAAVRVYGEEAVSGAIVVTTRRGVHGN